MKTNFRNIKFQRKIGLWVVLAGILIFYASMLGWLPFSQKKVLGAILAITTGVEAVSAYLTKRMDNRIGHLTAISSPKLFWSQFVLFIALSILGVVVFVVAK
jgi:pilus assembly protein TadC